MTFGQGDDPTTGKDPKAQEKIRAAHAAYLTERLSLTPDEAEKFWPVYREFLNKRRDLRQQFEDARTKGTDEKELIDLHLKIKQQELDLEKEYSPKLQNVISAQKLMSLREAEVDFQRLVIRQIRQREQTFDRRQRLRQRGNR